MLQFETIQEIDETALQDGDVLIELASDILFGRMVKLIGTADASEKGVPVAQHTFMRASNHCGEPTRIEAMFLVHEMPWMLGTGRYIVVRPTQATPAQIQEAVTYGRKLLWRSYGFRNLIRLGLNMILPWLRREELDDSDPVCSHLNADMYDHAGYPLPGFGGESDSEVKPWDWIVAGLRGGKFTIAGRITIQ